MLAATALTVRSSEQVEGSKNGNEKGGELDRIDGRVERTEGDVWSTG